MSQKHHGYEQFYTLAAINTNWSNKCIGSLTRQSRPAFLVDVNNEYERIVHTLRTLKSRRRQYCRSNSHNRRPFRCSFSVFIFVCGKK